jgi:hypothetical protein
MDKSYARIVKRGEKWCVVSEDGSKNLGCSSTKERAQKRLQQVEYFKHSKGQDMNYDQAFRNMAKAINSDTSPVDIGQTPQSRPTSVKLDSVVEGFSSGSIAGQISNRLLDKKDHFPVFTETQARSSMSRAMQLTGVPVWYGGSLDDLRKEVFEGIVKAHPTLASTLNVSVSAARIVATMSDGQTPAETSTGKIEDPNNVVKTQVPSVKRPTITTAEVARLCEDEKSRIAIAGHLMECIEKQETDIAGAKKMAQTLLKKGLTSEQFDTLSTYLQSDILREMLMSDASTASASVEDRRRELLERLNKKD